MIQFGSLGASVSMFPFLSLTASSQHLTSYSTWSQFT